MSEQSRGPGWWRASDGRWYPPEQWTGPEETGPAAPEPKSSPLPPPYNGPPTASVAPVLPAAVSPPGQTPTSGVTASVAGPATRPVAWYHTWWAMAPLLLLCWPLAIVLLWTSPQSRTAKVTGTAISTVLFGLFLVSGAMADPPKEDEAAKAIDRTTTTTEQATTTVKPTTTTTTTTTNAAPTTTTTAAPTTTTPPTTAPPPPPTAPPISPSQSNARRSASSYLEYTAFSRSGLIEQLEYEGFPRAEAEWAVDDLNPDWNEQAAKKAATYLEYTAFSRSGLIEQLLYEGFTQGQAEYGVSTTGL